MSLNKAIEHGKEKRKPYFGAKAVDPYCRNHGLDDWALSNRVHKFKKKLVATDERIEEFEYFPENVLEDVVSEEGGCSKG